LPVRGIDRPPRQCSSLDLQTADHVIALDETEHRPLMRERFPSWEPGAEYWQVADIDRLLPSVALQLIETQIDALLSRPDFGTTDRKQH
jgi:protein-tyrosine phosphatase